MKLAAFEAVAKALDAERVRYLVAGGLPVRFVSIPVLIAMKEAADRPRDVDDIQNLKWLQEDSDDD